jgi:uncharacterized protein YbjT (DUF2867 family)
MTTIAIAGGTGTLGALTASELRHRGHDVRVLARGSAEHPVDLTTGRGLESALAGVDVVIQAANGPSSGRAAGVLVEGTRRLLAASPAHHVCVSIVGIEHVRAAYYRVKLAQEAAVRESAQPWTILRATQFHELLAPLLDRVASARVRLHSAARLQPVAAAEAARALADVAEGPARHETVTVAGPEIHTLTELGSGRPGVALPLPVPLPPRLGRALRAGALTTAAPDVRGSITWKQWRASS